MIEASTWPAARSIMTCCPGFRTASLFGTASPGGPCELHSLSGI